MKIPPIFRLLLLVPLTLGVSGCEEPEEGNSVDDDTDTDTEDEDEDDDGDESGDDAEDDDGGSESGDGDDGDGDTEDSGGEDDGQDSGGDSGDSDDGDDDGGTEGCGEDYPDKGGVTLTATINGVEREFIFVVPTSYDPDTPYPLVFGMHGLNGSGQVLRSYASIEEQTAGNAIHVYPSAINGQWDLMPTGDDLAFFDELVEFATSTVCIDPDRIFSYGHSYGGYYSNTLGCYRGDVLRAIGPISGGGPGFGQATNCVGNVAAILMHGTDDSTVPISAGEGSRDHWLEANGCTNVSQPIEPEPCVEYQGCDGGLPVVWCQHMGIGHNVPWGGFMSTLDYGPDALWNFFLRFD